MRKGGIHPLKAWRGHLVGCFLGVRCSGLDLDNILQGRAPLCAVYDDITSWFVCQLFHCRSPICLLRGPCAQAVW